MAKKIFKLILVKPSHYDDDGYVIRWWRAMTPSNSLASVYGLARECKDNHALGPDVEIEIDAIDETNKRVDVAGIIRTLRRNDGFGAVFLIGVQSNQYPRSLDIARPLRAAGIPVLIGGFHVSGILSMLDGKGGDLEAAYEMGATIFAGEAENQLTTLLQDIAGGTLKPLYNFMNDLPSMEGTATPFLPQSHINRTLGRSTSFDAGRGCPYQCSFCTIINVQGRKSRFRTPDDIENLIRANWAQGVDRYFITDDNFARNKRWEEIFDRIIELRERENMPIGLMLQVDTLCHKIPRFIEKAKLAGVTRVFIGLENINPENLMAAKKQQNKITEYRKMLLAWKSQGILTLAGYILGFPADTPESIIRDIEILKRELPIDVVEFFCLTPLPGSEDHRTLYRKGIWMDPDLNKYDTEHVVTGHPKMTQAEWEAVYHKAWATYYTPEHMQTVIRRAVVSGSPVFSLAKVLVTFANATAVENVHPLQAGLIRIKRQSERRPGTPHRNPIAFYAGWAVETVRKQASAVRSLVGIVRMKRRAERDPLRFEYTDLAMTAVTEGETETLEMFKSANAESFVARQKKIAEIKASAAAA